MPLRTIFAAVVLVLAGCTTSGADDSDVTVPPTTPPCVGAHPADVIATSGCLDGTEFQTVAVFTCDNGRTLYGIDNRWAFAGDDLWTIGGQPLWDACRDGD